MKKYKTNIIILILISVLIMYLIMKDDFNNIIDAIKNVDVKFLLIALILMTLYIFFQSMSLHLYLKSIKKDYKLKDTFILMCSAQFFNAITPFSSGGQPFQMYLLKKQGIKVTDSGNALLQNFFTYQLALIIMGTFAVITNSFLHIIPSTSLLKNIVLIGYIVNIIVLVLLFSLGKAKNLNTKVFNKIFNFVFGFKFIKNREHLKEVASKKIDEFYNSSVYFKDNKFILVKSTFYNIIGLTMFYLIPLFIFYSIGKYNLVSILDSIVCTSYTCFVGSFVPIPGGTGGLEYAFMEFFKGFSSKTIISVSMILWRFMTYYLPMILGAVSILFIKNRKEELKE